MRATRMARRRGLLAAGLLATLALVVGALAVHQAMPAWYARLWHPLRYEEPIRAEAARHDLDPVLIAAMIEAESGFVADARSPEGAVGLMQVLPETAVFVASRPGRPSPSPERLEDPAVNVAYGAHYLRYLLDRLGSVPLALAAYNGGETNLRRWRADVRAQGRPFRVPEDLAFPETRAYVERVLELRAIYRQAYGEELGEAH